MMLKNTKKKLAKLEKEHTTTSQKLLSATDGKEKLVLSKKLLEIEKQLYKLS